MYSAERKNLVISDAEEQDFIQIYEIYSHYVLNSTATFEEIPPSLEEMLQRWKNSTS